MQDKNQQLVNIINNLSSIYKKDDGIKNYNIYTILNAIASELQDVSRIIVDTKSNTYLNEANADSLQDNFGTMVDFKKPPRLNNLTNGDEIYRAILKALYNAFLNGSTVDSMKIALETVLSFITIDPNGGITSQTDNITLTKFDNSITLFFNAVSSSGTTPSINDFSISPSGIIYPTSYNVNTKTLSFTGNIPASGQYFDVVYYKNNATLSGTNWINMNDETIVKPLSYDLNTIENTYFNMKYSYWWNTYNRDGQGVQIIDGALDKSEQALVWRLPEKSITFKDKYDGTIKEYTIPLYNYSGQVYDINNNDKEINPDVLVNPSISDYTSQISKYISDYYVRYSNNNEYFIPLNKFNGSFTAPGITKNSLVSFSSNDFGALDFFEKGDNFNENDLFGTGTKHVWTNVLNNNGYYTLSDNNLFERPYNLHEEIFFNENFESGEVSKNRFIIKENVGGNILISDIIGTPINNGEDCLSIILNTSGLSSTSKTSIYANVDNLQNINNIKFDISDPLDKNSEFYVDINMIDENNIQKTFRYGLRGMDISDVDSFVETKKYGFLESYFNNINATNYTIYSNKPYILISGNNNINYSNYSVNLDKNSTTIVNINKNILNQSTLFEIDWKSQYEGMIINIGYIKPIPNTYRLDGKQAYSYSEFNLQTPNISVYNLASGSYNYINREKCSNWGFTDSGKYKSGGGQYINQSQFLVKPFDFNNLSFTTSGIFINDSNISTWNILGLQLARVITHTPNEYYCIDDFNINATDGVKISYSSPLSGINNTSSISHLFFGNQINSTLNIYNTSTQNSYFYEVYSGNNIIDGKVLNQITRKNDWRTLNLNINNGIINFNVNEKNIASYNIGQNYLIGMSGSYYNPESISLNFEKENGSVNYFIDNYTLSCYSGNSINTIFEYSENLYEDWQGSYLGQSTIIDNKVFKDDQRTSFVFEISLKGVTNKYVYILEKIIDKLKPAHTMVELDIQTDHDINTTSQIIEYLTDERNWENGQIGFGGQITENITNNDIDLPGSLKA